jgi:hypothetical protein
MKNFKTNIGWPYKTYGDRRGAYRILAGKYERKSHLEDLDADGTIILKWILKK